MLTEKQKTDHVTKENVNLASINAETEKEYDDLHEKYQELNNNFEKQNIELKETCAALEKLDKIKKFSVNEREVLKAEVDTVSGKLTALNTALERSRSQRGVLLNELNRSKQKASDLVETGEETKQAIVKR